MSPFMSRRPFSYDDRKAAAAFLIDFAPEKRYSFGTMNQLAQKVPTHSQQGWHTFYKKPENMSNTNIQIDALMNERRNQTAKSNPTIIVPPIPNPPNKASTNDASKKIDLDHDDLRIMVQLDKPNWSSGLATTEPESEDDEEWVDKLFLDEYVQLKELILAHKIIQVSEYRNEPTNQEPENRTEKTVPATPSPVATSSSASPQSIKPSTIFQDEKSPPPISVGLKSISPEQSNTSITSSKQVKLSDDVSTPIRRDLSQFETAGLPHSSNANIFATTIEKNAFNSAQSKLSSVIPATQLTEETKKPGPQEPLTSNVPGFFPNGVLSVLQLQGKESFHSAREASASSDHEPPIVTSDAIETTKNRNLQIIKPTKIDSNRKSSLDRVQTPSPKKRKSSPDLVQAPSSKKRKSKNKKSGKNQNPAA